MAAKIKVDREEFARLNEDGLTITQLAQHFNVTPSTISRLRRGLNANRDQRRLMTPERKTKIQGMLDDGWSFKEIQRTEGADLSTLRRHFPGQQWTPSQAQEHVSAVRPIFRQLRRAERFAAMSHGFRDAA